MKVLFVCLGNICRSPLAHGVLEHWVQTHGLDIEVDSAGTGGWHVGDPPDPRSILVSARHGIDISAQRARQLKASDFAYFDLILGMDRNNVSNIKAMTPENSHAHVDLFLAHCLDRNEDVADPYYGGEEGFDECYRTILAGVEALGTRLGGGTVRPPKS